MSRGKHPQETVLFAYGETFGRLTVLERATTRKHRGPQYKCGCSCGGKVTVKASKLRKMEVTSCGRCPNAVANGRVS